MNLSLDILSICCHDTFRHFIAGFSIADERDRPAKLVTQDDIKKDLKYRMICASSLSIEYTGPLNTRLRSNPENPAELHGSSTLKDH